MDDEHDDVMANLLAHSLEGNALGVKDAVDSLMTARAMDAIQSMKVDVAQSIYGNYASDEDGAESEEQGEVDFEVTDDEYLIGDDEVDDLFAELDDLTDQEPEEAQDGDDTDV